MRKSIRDITAILSATSVVGGVAVLAISGFQYKIAMNEASNDYLPAMQQEWASDTPTITSKKVALSTGTFLGVIDIDSLKLKVNLFEGTEKKDLARGAGHYRASVMPGQSDNTVIAGHRDTVFSSLGKIKKGASIVITTRDGIFTYLVTGTRIVNKNDKTVIVPTESATVTLSTCYPFRFIGSAPKRFVVTGILAPTVL
jgi:sortase A